VNINTVASCITAVFAGLFQRYTHRFKSLQIVGIGALIVGWGLNYLSVSGNSSMAVIITSRVILGIGGGITIISTQVASQGSVPHADLAISIAIISLISAVAGAVGSAVAAATWNRRVPAMLNKLLGGSLDVTDLAAIFGSISVARGTEPRELVIEGESCRASSCKLGCSAQSR
jgi:MFS family permease